MELQPSLSPYQYASNNPVIFIDPTGLIEYRFNQDGEYTEEYDDWSEEVTGAAYQYDKDGKMGDQITTFTFNELEDKDMQKINRANIDISKGNSSGLFIDLDFESRIDRLANQGLGENADKGAIGKYNYAARESGKFGQMDYHNSQLVEKDCHFYLAGGVAYNPMDAGNFLWGRGMATLGVSYNSTLIGSQLYSIFSHFSFKKPKIQYDSPADQRAIGRGYFWDK